MNWTSLTSTTSTNGLQTQVFTPTAAQLRKTTKNSTLKFTSFQLLRQSVGCPTCPIQQVWITNFTTPTIVKPSYDGWTINTQTQTLYRTNIGSSWRVRPNVEKTFTVTGNTNYRFSADMAYLSSGHGGFGSFSNSSGDMMETMAFSTIYDSIKVFKVVSGVATRITAVRSGYSSSTGHVYVDFLVPTGVTQILIQFVPGNEGSLTHAYYADNLRLSKLLGFTTIYTSNFGSITVTSQNTDGWSGNWSTSYMNVFAQTPTCLRVSGETPQVQRDFSVEPGYEYELAYTQSENNSVSFVVEQSSNGVNWTSLTSTTSTNGLQTQVFTPTAAQLRVRYSASTAFSLAGISLNGIGLDTILTVLPTRIAYRYGYNGMEKDPEAKGEGNSYTTYFRQYDPRLGRWLSLDPKMGSMPWQSPYCAMDNNPILHNDPLGDSVRYEKFRDRVNVFFAKLGNKEFRAEHNARKSSSDVYTYRKQNNEPDLASAREQTDLTLPQTTDAGSMRRIGEKNYVSVLYDKYGLGGTQANPSALQINFPKLDINFEYGIKTVREKGTIETPSAGAGNNPLYGPYTFNSPRRWVPGTSVDFRAASQPDIFTFTDQNQQNIVPPFAIVQGSRNFQGVTTTGGAWLTVPTSASVISWTVSVTTYRTWTLLDSSGNPTSNSSKPNSVFYIQYQKFRFFPNKIRIRFTPQ